MVIPDSRGRIRNWALIRHQQPSGRDAIALVSAAAPRAYLASLEGEGVEYILTGGTTSISGRRWRNSTLATAQNCFA